MGGYDAGGNNPPPAGSDAARAADSGKKEKDSGGNKWVSVILGQSAISSTLLTIDQSYTGPVVQQQVLLEALCS